MELFLCDAAGGRKGCGSRISNWVTGEREMAWVVRYAGPDLLGLLWALRTGLKLGPKIGPKTKVGLRPNKMIN